MAMQLKQSCTLIHSGQTYTGKQALTHFAGISAENSGAQGISMLLTTIPPGGRAKAHLHENHETTVYIMSGELGMWYGENLEEHLVARAGDFVYIPANIAPPAV